MDWLWQNPQQASATLLFSYLASHQPHYTTYQALFVNYMQIVAENYHFLDVRVQVNRA